MDQDDTWYGGRPLPRQHCVRWGPSSHLTERGTTAASMCWICKYISICKQCIYRIASLCNLVIYLLWSFMWVWQKSEAELVHCQVVLQRHKFILHAYTVPRLFCGLYWLAGWSLGWLVTCLQCGEMNRQIELLLGVRFGSWPRPVQCCIKRDSRGPIHRHCPKIYLKTCHKIILWQKLRCHKMILRHILCQFTKFVLGDLKYSKDMTRCHSNNDVRLFRLRRCIMILAPVPIFYPFVSVPVPLFDQANGTSTIRPLMWRRLVSLSALYNDD